VPFVKIPRPDGEVLHVSLCGVHFRFNKPLMSYPCLLTDCSQAMSVKTPPSAPLRYPTPVSVLVSFPAEPVFPSFLLSPPFSVTGQIFLSCQPKDFFGVDGKSCLPLMAERGFFFFCFFNFFFFFFLLECVLLLKTCAYH